MRPILLLVISCMLMQWAFAQTRSTTQTTVKGPAKEPVNVYAITDSLALLVPESATHTTDGIAAYISAHFKSDTDKTRAAFIWITHNIHYDVKNMFAINPYVSDAEKIRKVLDTRSGICEHFSLLFQQICSKVGIDCHIVSGYTRQKEYVDYIAHIWCAAKVQNKWFLFDPTWGAGSIINGTFVPSLKPQYYKAKGTALMASHMPFDFIWQLLNYPVTGDAFYTMPVRPDSSHVYCQYADSIKAMEQMDTALQYATQMRRLVSNGVKNTLCVTQLQYWRIKLQNLAVVDYNAGVMGFNKYIDYYNKQFRPARPDAEIQGMLTQCTIQLKAAADKLNIAEAQWEGLDESGRALRRQITDMQAKVKTQEEWLQQHFSKKAG
ncbi:transglutaminase domain-containing protein [Filimonas lacunae]|nr:transglutaminase domain-containing protein [Filimonas lacunae]